MEAEKSTNRPPPADPAAASAPPRRRGQKRKSTGGNSSAPQPTKRHARERAAAAATAAAVAAAEAAAAEASAATAAAAEAAAAAKEEAEAVMVSMHTNDVSKLVAEEEDLEAVEARVEAECESILVRDRHAHVVPTPAGWFSWTRIHLVEKQTLPSFFSGKSEKRTPEIYMEIRDWIMRKFHADPNTQIEMKDLSELSVGEMDARQEVMEFLDHWGLINYHPFPENDESAVNVDDKTETLNTLANVLYHFEKESCLPVVARDNLTTPAAPSTLFPESTVAEELVRQEEPEYHCNSCSADCSRKRYHCQVQADYDLCTECFTSRKFDSNMSPVDFILMEPAEAAGVSGGKWTDQETLLLLEAVELFSENWNEIADHVATKTKAQCILHFVQMPIEEYVMNIDNKNEATEREDGGSSKTDNDTSALKDASEISNTGTPPPKDENEMSKTENETPAPKDVGETTNSESRTDVNQLESSPMKVSVPEDASDKKVSEETNKNIALKALNEAFEVVGYDPTPGGQFSFAEAGNPVMALVAFLVRLAEPNVATAAARSSLKCISDNSSSIQLAARHCFLLEDPPGDKKTPAEADSELVEVDALKDGEQNKEKKTQEISVSVSENVDVPNDRTNDKDKNDVGNEKGTCSSPNNKSAKKSKKKKKLDLNKSDKTDVSKDQGTRDVKELDDLAPKTNLPKDSVANDKESDRSDLPEESVVTRSKDLNQIASSSVKEQGIKADEPSQYSKSAKENAASGALGSEMKEAANEKSKDNKNENQDPATASDEPNIDKLKRAAVTAISAAAVKAKFLADQEEDQIRQLATLLIEKQLHKLETKLAFFNEMDISVTRMREQMERTKQRLYQERAQIIATRFGVPQSASRPMQQQQQPSLPINRVAMGFASSAGRPPMGMNMMMPSQRPPMARPTMTSPPPSTFVPANSTSGFSTRPINPREN